MYVRAILRTLLPSVSFARAFPTQVAIVAAGVLLCTSANSQDIRFLFAPTTSTGLAPYSADAVDVDNDGDLDIVTANIQDQESGSISVLKNNGSGQFAAPVNYATGEAPMDAAFGDFNRDGFIDVVVANEQSGVNFGTDSTATVLLNNGDGTFGRRRDWVVGFNAQAKGVCVSDFNGDGKLDFAVACMWEGWVIVYLGQGDGTFVLQGQHNASSPDFVQAGDFNRDGRIDFVCASVNEAQIFINNGAGFTPGALMDNFPDNIAGLAVGDFNEDGAPDFATTGMRMTIWMNNGNGTSFTRHYYFTAQNANGIIVVDLDGDGHQDIALANYLANSISTYYNLGNGTFADFRTWGVGPNPWALGAGDFNHDSMMDIVAASSQLSQTTVSIVLNAGNRIFAARNEFPLIGSAAGVELADFNRDGFLDIVTGVYVGNQDRVAVLLGRPGGMFDEPNYIENFGNNIPTDVAVADFNNDSAPDIVLSIFSPGNRVRVLFNRGDGTFLPSVSCDAGGNPSGVVTGDLNNDGSSDIVCTNGALTDNTISVFINNRDGTFMSQVKYQTYLRPSDAVIADFDRDGDNDVFVTHSGSDFVLLFRNIGGGILTPVSFTGGGPQGNAVVGDYDRDGWLDVALAGGSIKILRNNRAGGFQAPYVTSVPAGRIATSDLDRDGDLDVVGTGYTMSQVYIGSNNGDGTMTYVGAMTSGYGTDRVATVDVNGDSLPEVFTANGSATSITMFRNVTVTSQLVNPTSVFTIGDVISGNLASLFNVDGNRMILQVARNAELTVPLRITVEAILPVSSAGRLDFVHVGRTMAGDGKLQQIALFDWVANRFIVVDSRLTQSVDQTSVATVIGNVARYIQPGTRRVRARVDWQELFSETAELWRTETDRAIWIVYP